MATDHSPVVGPLVATEQLPPVYLISGELPGTGATTLAKNICAVLASGGVEPFTYSFGEAVKQELGSANEADLAKIGEKVPDPKERDRQIYQNLPTDRPAVVEGKYATAMGPGHIDSGRPVVSINLSSADLFSAKRILEREGTRLEQLLVEGDPDGRLLGHLTHIRQRKAREDAMRATLPDRSTTYPNVTSHSFDTSQFLGQEISAKILLGEDFKGFVPNWELSRLKDVHGKLAMIRAQLNGNIHPSDAAHFSHQFESIGYHIGVLGNIYHAGGINKVRDELRKSITDCWFGLTIKRIPRFFTTEGPVPGEKSLTLDTESQGWTPEYYKIAEAWPILSSILNKKVVLDPFAGAGTFLNLLVARGIVKGAIYSDIAYAGGQPINGKGQLYEPRLNMQAAQLLFDDLPSWYKPNFSIVKGLESADAHKLPLKDNSVDYVCTDPPYDKNCPGGLGVTFGTLDESLRVAKRGAVMMVPLDWVKQLKAHGGYEIKTLTGDISRGNSGFPICYVKITKRKQ